MGVVARAADVIGIRHDGFRAADERAQIRIRLGIVDVHVLHAIHREIAFYDHHVATAAEPVPAECDGFLFAVNLRFDLAERECRIGGLVGRKTVFLVFRPAAVIAASGIIFAARREAETVIRFHALGDVMAQETHGHLAARRPAPVRRLLRQFRDVDCGYQRWITTGG